MADTLGHTISSKQMKQMQTIANAEYEITKLVLNKALELNLTQLELLKVLHELQASVINDILKDEVK